MRCGKIAAAALALLLTAGPVRADALPLKDAAEVRDRFTANPRAVSGIGDPFVLPGEDGWHVYATGAQVGFFHWNSPDLVSFERDKALKRAKWVYNDYWAP